VELERVRSFKYLGRILTDTDDDYPALYRNLSRARQRWGMVRRVLVRDGADPRTMAYFYKCVVQTVLLYGAETWVISNRMLRALEGFHYRVACQITGRRPQREGETWVHPPTAAVLEEAGMHSMGEYLSKHRAHLVTYVTNRPIFGLCQEAERLPGSRPRKFWWDQLVPLEE
jgi:hypothetical protein